MNTIDYFGKELVLKPINKVRVRFRDGAWHVEYRSKKWFFNFWSVEGQYRDFMDAKTRAETLKTQGGFFTLQDIVIEMDVNTDVIEDPVVEDPVTEVVEEPKKSWFARIFQRS